MERRRGRLVARQMRDRRQQQLARLGVVAPHVELGHPDLVVALGRLLRRQRGRQPVELDQRLVPVAVLGQRLGALQTIGDREIVGRRGGGWRGLSGRGDRLRARRGRGRRPASAQRLVAERMRREVARDGQELLLGAGGIARRRRLGDPKARQRDIARRRRGLLDQRRVGLGRRRPIALHPEAIGDPKRRHRRGPAAMRACRPLERGARGGVVAVVELALAQEERRPVLVAQLLAERRLKCLRGLVVFAGAIRRESAGQARGRLGRRRRSVRRPERDRQSEAQHGHLTLDARSTFDRLARRHARRPQPPPLPTR